MPTSSKTNAQRIIIWIIAVVMAVGTLGSFFIFMLPAANKPVATQAEIDAQKQQQEYQDSLKPLEGYMAEQFDADSVTELKTEDLVTGDGTEVTEESTISANYFGWTSDGKIFDSTNSDGTTNPVQFSLKEVIEGWSKGLAGSKQGSVRKLTIPAEQAYGKETNGMSPAGPLMFIVEIKEVK